MYSVTAPLARLATTQSLSAPFWSTGVQSGPESFVKETSVAPLGAESVRWTFWAGSGPALPTWMMKAMFPPVWNWSNASR